MFPTLREAGIDKHLADRARKFVAIPIDEFSEIVSDCRDRIEQEGEQVAGRSSGCTPLVSALANGKNAFLYGQTERPIR